MAEDEVKGDEADGALWHREVEDVGRVCRPDTWGWKGEIPALPTECVPADPITRVACEDVGVAEFRDTYERPRLPVIITGCADDWPARRLWTLELLEERLGDAPVEMDHPPSYDDVPMLDYCNFCDYMRHQKDIHPLYVFDSCFDLGTTLPGDYSPPKYFTGESDLFGLMSRVEGPPFRWFLVGPVRSGSRLHQDPLATSAWNTVLVGRKRWILFDPETPKELLFPSKPGKEVDHDAAADAPHRESFTMGGGRGEQCPLQWFTHTVPSLVAAVRAAGHTALDFVLEAGETVFVPSGWWHAVLNLTATVAVTQNFVSEVNFRASWDLTSVREPEVAAAWLTALDSARPDLARVARARDAERGLRTSAPAEELEAGERADAEVDHGQPTSA